MESQQAFFKLLDKISDHGVIKSPDFIAISLPLIEAVAQLHHSSQVAFLSNLDVVGYNDSFLYLNGTPKAAQKSNKPLFKKPRNKGPLEVSGTFGETTDLNEMHIKQSNLEVLKEGEDVQQPIYIPRYRAWDLELEHYDPLTDIFLLGQLLASVAYNLNFTDSKDLELFVSNRKSLYFLNKNLHPTIHAVILEMTNLYREDRTENLDEIITKLKNYREYNPENYIDLTQTDGFRNQDLSDRNSWILSRLKNRLFDISRRNKLLYFSERSNFLNLTISSVPLLLDHENIQENSLIFWNEGISSKVVKKKQLALNSFIDFKENRYLAPTINKIRLEARKSQNEYGFSQMRMVIAFLHWYNFKENTEERITSPLLLVPAEVVKKKGVEDTYTLKFSTTEAEINPILSNFLKDLYDLELPDFIDLENTSISELIESIQTQISQGGTGIQLNWRQKPRIQLIHKIAKKNFNLKNKHLHKRSQGMSFNGYNYSYDKENFKPLGFQIFEDRIRSKNNALEYIINEDLRPEQNLAVAEKSRTFYQTDNDGDINPLVWEMDTCNLTIGNFNYRKMSLVRDYNEIINSSIQDEVFEELFSELPKRLELDKKQIPLQDNYPIIQSDPTQTGAVELARTGKSYIIQGPPGTGKSQTITNLIADYISRDKKVLFVCEKRAALDVVYHRLKNKDLDELCCLVHDSQMDKKSFIQDLKQVYHQLQSKDLDAVKIESERKKVVDTIKQSLDELTQFHKSMTVGDVSPQEIFHVLHATKLEKELPSEIDCIKYPSFLSWKENETWITEWLTQLPKNGFQPSIADYPLAQLSTEILTKENPKAAVLEKVEKSLSTLDEFIELIDELDLDYPEGKLLSSWNHEFTLVDELAGLCESDSLEILDEKSGLSQKLKEILNDVELKQENLLQLQDKNKNWKDKFSKEDTEIALQRWGKLQTSSLRFFTPSYYRLKKQVKLKYDFSAHEIKPTIADILLQLQAEYKKLDEINVIKSKQAKELGLEDFDQGLIWIEGIKEKADPIVNQWVKSNNTDYILNLKSCKNNYKELKKNSSQLFSSVENLSLKALDQKLNESKQAVFSLSIFLPFIQEANKSEEALQYCLFEKRWNISEFQFNLAYKSLLEHYEKNRSFADTDESSLQINIQRINALLGKYYESNVKAIQSKIHQKFTNIMRITESSAAQLTEEEKTLKKIYRSGRKILENEFGKSMRYKSIRELTSGDSKDLMTTIKPVWLMSPLSVSDVLPIDTSIFDVVIFDEASQITVEEGVPSLFRTHQTIVVGDEMQMPPTNFFSTSGAQDENEEEVEEKVGISLDAESLLNQSARKFASVMLGWHYRSRHEDLISFSNAAFYRRELLTIPDIKADSSVNTPMPPIVDSSEKVDVNNILNRSISFHYLENAAYVNRKNKDEAVYIANIVRELLNDKTRKSIGIVAFSMDQQSEIESALERLASEDANFEHLLEAEYQREDEDQFNGLFVKNLENVQGDERDIIIMSVCYGFNNNGKMLMNFGPINRRGGEKRLNVIFSRAKEHMVVVSSILPNHIKNDYNEGANYFKKFLSYARYCSDGRSQDADLVLDEMHKYEEDLQQAANNLVLQELKSTLEEKGYKIDLSVGRSHFKCDIAIKNETSNDYILGILIDKNSHYENSNILEQYCQKPEILKAFGWNIISVYSKDWFERPESVIKKIEALLSGEQGIDTAMFDIEEIDLILEGEIAKEDSDNPKTNIMDDTKNEENVAPSQFERYEYKDGNSNKFWEISLNNNIVIVRFGRIGNSPQVKEKNYETNDLAEKEKHKQVQRKLNKGYTKV